jgi:Domain of unknown function (DUF4278)
MVQLSEYPQVQSAIQPSATTEAIRTLTYRGTTYEVSQPSVSAHTPAEIEQLIGKHLYYRGTTYEMIPASILSTMPEAKSTQQLRYRGMTYSSRAQSNPSVIDYRVV